MGGHAGSDLSDVPRPGRLTKWVTIPVFCAFLFAGATAYVLSGTQRPQRPIDVKDLTYKEFRARFPHSEVDPVDAKSICYYQQNSERREVRYLRIGIDAQGFKKLATARIARLTGGQFYVRFNEQAGASIPHRDDEAPNWWQPELQLDRGQASFRLGLNHNARRLRRYDHTEVWQYESELQTLWIYQQIDRD